MVWHTMVAWMVGWSEGHQGGGNPEPCQLVPTRAGNLVTTTQGFCMCRYALVVLLQYQQSPNVEASTLLPASNATTTYFQQTSSPVGTCDVWVVPWLRVFSHKATLTALLSLALHLGVTLQPLSSRSSSATLTPSPHAPWPPSTPRVCCPRAPRAPSVPRVVAP